MTTLKDRLHEADSVRSTPLHDDERAAMRQSVLAALPIPPPVVERSFVRRHPILMVAMLAVAGVLVVARLSPPSGTTLHATVRFEARLAESAPGNGLVEAAIGGDGGRTYLRQSAVVSNGDVAQAEVVDGADVEHFGVLVTFTSEGAQKMRDATASHLGEPMAILIDGQVVAAPILRSPIDNTALLSGNFSKAEAERIAAGIVRF